MSMRDLLGKLARIDESMKSDTKKPTGPKFPGYWKGTDKASQAKNKMVGGSAEESIIKDLEKALVENPRTNAHQLMREFQEFKESADEFVLYVNDKPASKYNNLGQAEQDLMMLKQRVPSAKIETKKEVCKMMPVEINESFINQLIAEELDSKQAVIAHFVKQGKSAAAGAAAWERGYRGPKAKARPTKATQAGQKYWWQDKEDLNEYGGTGGYGAASQAPQGSTNQNPDPKAQQQKMDQQQIQKNTNQLSTALNQQGAAQPLNKVKFSDTMTKLDDKPNTDLNAQELKQMEPLAVATSKALQNPQTAAQMKQLITKADTVDKQKELKVQQAQQQTGTNQPAGQQPQQSTNTAQQNPVPGQTK